MSTNDELRELLAKATPGPWRWNAPTGSVVSNQSHPVAYVSEAAHRLRFDGTTGEDGPLIVAAVNALPDLLARLDSLAGEVAELRADRERLDYIERTFSGMTNRERYLPVQMIWGVGCNGRTLREACDKYMKRDSLAAKPKGEL